MYLSTERGNSKPELFFKRNGVSTNESRILMSVGIENQYLANSTKAHKLFKTCVLLLNHTYCIEKGTFIQDNLWYFRIKFNYF